MSGWTDTRSRFHHLLTLCTFFEKGCIQKDINMITSFLSSPTCLTSCVTRYLSSSLRNTWVGVLFKFSHVGRETLVSDCVALWIFQTFKNVTYRWCRAGFWTATKVSTLYKVGINCQFFAVCRSSQAKLLKEIEVWHGCDLQKDNVRYFHCSLDCRVCYHSQPSRRKTL